MLKNEKIIITFFTVIAIFALIVYNIEKTFEPTFTQPPGTAEIIYEPNRVIELPEIKITGFVTPRLCNWYGKIGLLSLPEIRAETTCQYNTCFLLVHDTDLEASFVILAWLSSLVERGHSPSEDGIQMSVFTFKEGKNTDHVIYFPSHDIFISR